MIAILAVKDVKAACARLEAAFGFEALGDGNYRFGAQDMRVVGLDEAMDGLVPMNFDHVAFGVGDIESFEAAGLQKGLVLDADYTPEGVQGIPEFWEQGVRYVFFAGPEGVPFEFCQKLGRPFSDVSGAHFGIRTSDIAAEDTKFAKLGAKLLAKYVLGEGVAVVNVRFYQIDDQIFELFDAPGGKTRKNEATWIGFIPVVERNFA